MEYDAAREAALQTNGRTYGVHKWEQRDAKSAEPYLLGRYTDESGASFTVALARPTRQGAAASVPLSVILVERLKPRCLAMCGVCAGNPKEVALGDVVISEMTYFYGEGKVNTEGFEGDHRQSPISETWLRAAQDLVPEGLPSFGQVEGEEPKFWLLERLYAREDPLKHNAQTRYFEGNSWATLTDEYIREKLMRRKGLALQITVKGKQVVEEHLFREALNTPKRLPFRIKVGPIASGDVVVKDGLTWGRLATLGVRTVLGLDMEAAGIGLLAHRQNIRDWVVVKGVMDHADPKKADRYKAFAARSSAEVLFRLLSRQLGIPSTEDQTTSPRVGAKHSPKTFVAKDDAVRHPFLLRAIRNIAEYGDTDVFPYPPEKHLFHTMEREALEALTDLYDTAPHRLQTKSPAHETLLAQVGYTGFRWVTQLDPLWNAYFLGLCISSGKQIEASRIPTRDECIFSYRFHDESGSPSMFDTEIGWPDFIERSNELAAKYSYVVKCDIADFYHRIPHERLITALSACGVHQETRERIHTFLSRSSSGPSIGLPVGGPAARLLAEVVLNKTDHVLRDKGIPFCRFADDYHLFADSLDSAYTRLISLSELLRQEGLTLQKLKTRILTQKEFARSTGPTESARDDGEKELTQFLSLKLRFDPYASNAAEQYNQLAHEIEAFDILGMLSREMAKSRINELATKRLVRAVKFLKPGSRNQAVKELISKDRASVLAPVFPTLLILLRDVNDKLSEEVQEHVFRELNALYEQSAPILKLDLNIAFWLRILARAPLTLQDEARKQCVRIYEEHSSKLVRRDAILAVADLRGLSWLSTIIAKFDEKSAWEKRALIATSHLLEGERREWMKGMAETMDESERLYDAWGGMVVQQGIMFIS